MGDRVLVEAVYNPNMPFKWNAQRIQTLPQLPNQTVSKINLPNWSTTQNRNNQHDNWFYNAFKGCHCGDVDYCAFNLHIAPGGPALTSSFPTAVQLLLWRRSTTLHWHIHSGGFKTKCNLSFEVLPLIFFLEIVHSCHADIMAVLRFQLVKEIFVVLYP